jgi:hypothetical protein
MPELNRQDGYTGILYLLRKVISDSAASQRKVRVSMRTFIGAVALISRISPSRIESLFDFGWQRIVKILGNRELTTGPAKFAFRACVAHGRQFGHRHIGAHDGNFLSLFDPFEETREMSLGLVNIDFHAWIVA